MTEEHQTTTAREGKLKQRTRNDHMESSDSALLQRTSTAADLIERVRSNQQKLAAALKPHYDLSEELTGMKFDS
jgi:hypothetical protein